MTKSISPIYFITNVGGALLFFYLWLGIVAFARAEHRTYFDTSDSISFIGETWPIVLIAFLVNLSWLAKSLIDIIRRRGLKASAWFGAVVAVWAVAFIAMRLSSSLA